MRSAVLFNFLPIDIEHNIQYGQTWIPRNESASESNNNNNIKRYDPKGFLGAVLYKSTKIYESKYTILKVK